MPARVVAAAVCSLFMLVPGRVFAQQVSFSRSDIATGLSLWGPEFQADFNGDGVPDLLVATHSLTENFALYLMAGHGDGTFAAPVRVLTALAGGSIGVADFTRDGTPDVVLLFFGETWVVPGRGNGSFGPPLVSAGVISGRPPVIGDFDRDGLLDVAFIEQDQPAASVLLGKGDGTFGPPHSFPLNHDGGAATALEAADLNGDGFLDLVATDVGFPLLLEGTTVSVVLGRGDGTFGAPASVPVGTSPMAIVAADFNRDGHVDLAVANSTDSTVSVLLGRGDGTFLAKTDYPVGPLTARAVSADFTGDGRLDLAVCGLPDVLSILPGRGDGTFGPRQDIAAAFDCEALVAGDLDRDGRPDLTLTYSSGQSALTIFMNTTPAPDAAPPTITVSAAPSVLWPPNGKVVPVVVTGVVSDVGSGVDASTVVFSVRDDYGLVQPSGGVAISPDGTYMILVPLVASRRGHDVRTYTVVVSARDRAGNTASARAVVVVPQTPRH
jgi:VCBS repeat protein